MELREKCALNREDLTINIAKCSRYCVFPHVVMSTIGKIVSPVSPQKSQTRLARFPGYNTHMSLSAIDQWLGAFSLDGWIRDHVAAVFANLPEEVRSDLMGDPEFVVCDFDPGPDVIFHVPMRFSNKGKPARSIVLKRTIKRRPIEFARWVIAHELAHAYLRHGGRWPHEDPEHAADSLAAEWGFPRPG